MNALVCAGNCTEINLVMTAVDQRLWLAARQQNVQEIEVEKPETRTQTEDPNNED